MFRFTIRDVLWLTVVTALSVALGINEYRLAAMRERLRDQTVKYAHLAARREVDGKLVDELQEEISTWKTRYRMESLRH
jgi:hypothetical protein